MIKSLEVTERVSEGVFQLVPTRAPKLLPSLMLRGTEVIVGQVVEGIEDVLFGSGSELLATELCLVVELGLACGFAL